MVEDSDNHTWEDAFSLEELEESKVRHIAYIQAVGDYCGLASKGLTEERLLEESIGSIYNLSKKSEELYELTKEIELVDRILKEIEAYGIGYVRDMYNIPSRPKEGG